MTPDQQWHLVQIAEGWLPIACPLAILFALPRSRCSFRWRAGIAIFATWLMWVLFITEIYNPLGVARAERLGAESPWEGFDNNDTVPIIFFGWLIPVFVIAVVQLCRLIWRRFCPSTRSAPL